MEQQEEEEEEEQPPRFVRLPDGRHISYREIGCSSQTARKSLLVLHGLGSSRLAAMPGVSADLLKEFRVRLVAIDRPGYGQSDPHDKQTLRSSTDDIEAVIDGLGLGEKVWLLGYSCGGAYCWAAARYIPGRIAGIAMWCPVGNYWWKGITRVERKRMFSTLTCGSRALLSCGRLLPFILLRLYVRLVIMPTAGSSCVKHCQRDLSAPDRQHLQLPAAANLMLRDNLESLTRNQGFGMAKDLHMVTTDWGFEPSDVEEVFKGPIHLWQGDDDKLVPVSLQRWVKKQLPSVVQLHELASEGHLSWFCFNWAAHEETLVTLFGKP